MPGCINYRGSSIYFLIFLSSQELGSGEALMPQVEQEIKYVGFPEFNFLWGSENATVSAFFERIGYVVKSAVTFLTRLINERQNNK